MKLDKERVFEILDTIQKDKLDGPRDLDVALDALFQLVTQENADDELRDLMVDVLEYLAYGNSSFTEEDLRLTVIDILEEVLHIDPPAPIVLN